MFTYLTANRLVASLSASQFFVATMSSTFVISTLRLIGATIFVALLAYYVTRLMAGARLRKSRSRGKGTLQLIESINITRESGVHLVKAADKYMVVGVTKENVNLLAELSEEDLPEIPESTADQANVPFGKLLSRFINKQGNND